MKSIFSVLFITVFTFSATAQIVAPRPEFKLTWDQVQAGIEAGELRINWPTVEMETPHGEFDMPLSEVCLATNDQGEEIFRTIRPFLGSLMNKETGAPTPSLSNLNYYKAKVQGQRFFCKRYSPASYCTWLKSDYDLSHLKKPALSIYPVEQYNEDFFGTFSGQPTGVVIYEVPACN